MYYFRSGAFFTPLCPVLIRAVLYMEIMLPVKAGISNLIRSVTWKKVKNHFLSNLYDVLLDRSAPSMVKAAVRKARGYSSAGRALEWHSRGQRFDPA